MNRFFVGQRVAFVRDYTESDGIRTWKSAMVAKGVVFPVLDAVYTIRELTLREVYGGGEEPCLLLLEVRNDDMVFSTKRFLGISEPAFGAWRFEPLVSDESMERMRRLLDVPVDSPLRREPSPYEKIREPEKVR